MKGIRLAAFLIAMTPAVLRGQPNDSSLTLSRLALENTANVLPGTSVGFQGGASAFTSNSDMYRYRLIVGASGIVELDFANIGEVQTMLYNIRQQTSWGVKVRLYGPSESTPVLALLLRSSIGWQDEWNQSIDFQNSRPELYQRGIGIVRYQYAFTRAQLIVSYSVFPGALVSLGMGAVDLQVRNTSIWGNAANALYPLLYNVNGVKHTATVQGFVSVLYPVSTRLVAIAEGESMPFVNTSGDLNSVNVERAFCGSMGIRYCLDKRISLDGTYFAVTNGSDSPVGELRFGLNVMFAGM